MKSTKLALVPSAPTTVAEHKAVDGSASYTPTERATIGAYQTALAAGRYFRLYDASSPFPRLISGENTEPLPLAFLAADFGDWCDENGYKRPAKMPTETYLAYPLKTVTGTVFVPNGPSLIRADRARHRYVNTYRRFEPQYAAVLLSPLFHEFIACLFPDPEERHTFLQYCSHMIRFPNERPSWHPMLLSETGTGKGFLFNDLLSPLLCHQTFVVKRYGEILGKFSPVMERSLLVLLDDCKTKREDTQTALKSLMTEERVLMEKKGLQGAMGRTYVRFILASNEDVPLDLDESERRWWVPKRLGYATGLTGKPGRDDRQALIKELAAWVKTDGALEAIYNFFLEYQLDGFDPKNCPMTVTLQQQIDKSETVEQGFARDFLSRHATKVVQLAELQTAFVGAGMNKPGNNALPALFAFCQYRKDTLEAKGQRRRWWFPSSMTKAEAEAILEAEPDF